MNNHKCASCGRSYWRPTQHSDLLVTVACLVGSTTLGGGDFFFGRSSETWASSAGSYWALLPVLLEAKSSTKRVRAFGSTSRLESLARLSAALYLICSAHQVSLV